MSALPAPFTVRARIPQDPVQRGDRAQIRAGTQQPGPHLTVTLGLVLGILTLAERQEEDDLVLNR